MGKEGADVDNKRFMELFPELKENTRYEEKQVIWKNGEKEKNKKIEREQKKEEEVKRKEFFDHMKMQLRPERSWELSEAWKQKIWKKKKGKRKLLMYSATAAACLILVIVLPNLSELLKMSEQEEMSKHENVAFVLEDHSDENKEENVLDNGNKEKEVLDEEKDKDNMDQKEIVQKETKQDPVDNNLKDKIKEKEKEKTVDNQGTEDIFSDHSTTGGKKGIEETVQETGKQKKKSKDKKQSDGKMESKKKDQKDIQKDNTKSKDIEKGNHDSEQDQKSEIQTGGTEHDNVDSTSIDDRDVNTTFPENIIRDEINDENTEVTAETTTGGNDTAINNIAIDDTSDDAIEKATDAVAEIAIDTENDFVLQDNVTPESVQAPIESEDEITDVDFQNALHDFKEEEQEADIEDQNDSGESKKITKEAMEKKLKTYPYLYYNQEQKESWYYAEEKLQSSVDGKKLLGMALIFKEKSLVIEEHGNAQQSVFIYGDEKDLSIVFIRFWAEGKDWYYEYKQ